MKYRQNTKGDILYGPSVIILEYYETDTWTTKQLDKIKIFTLSKLILMQ